MKDNVYLRFEDPDIDSITHFGVKGMHWGVWNDETRRRRLGLSNRKATDIPHPVGRKTPSLSDSQKKALKTAAAIGVGAAVLGVGIYAVRNGYLDAGEAAATKALGQLDKNASSVIAKTKSGTLVHSIKESHVETLQNTNPLKDNKNCKVCSMTGVLRSHFGIDAEARPGRFDGTSMDLWKECFPGCKTVPKTSDGVALAKSFASSKQEASAKIVKAFGDNAKGVASFGWAGKDKGHAISWVVENGKTSFFDYQTGEEIKDAFWNMPGLKIDPNKELTLARLDDVAPDFDALEKYVRFK